MNFSSVPKFASFRPKEPAKPSAERKRSPVQEEEHRRHKHKERERHRKDNERSREHSSHRRHHTSTVSSSKDVPSQSKTSAELRTPSGSDKPNNEFFVIDKKGDPSNIKYKGLDRWRVPAYRRYGFGCVLEIPVNRRIDRDLSTDNEIVLSDDRPARYTKRLLTSQSKTKESSRLVRFIKPAGVETTLEKDLDYIPIPGSLKRKRGEELSLGLEGSEIDYRSIEGKAKAEDDLDADMKYASDESIDPHEDMEAQAREENARLSRRTRDEQHNLQAWIDLVDHQAVTFGAGRSVPLHKLSSSDRRNLADIKISIYEQALKQFENNADAQIKLLLGVMSEASSCWEPKRVVTKWKDILIKFPGSIEVWTRYLDFAQGNFVDFKYEDCRTTFRDCLQVLASAQCSKEHPADSLVELQLYVLTRATSMIRDAGYQELALAIWQALFEFHIFTPSTQAGAEVSNTPLSQFEEFWESEVPRVGEADARGWKQYNVNTADAPSPVTIRLSQNVRLKSVFEDFLKREIEHTGALRLPGRTSDDAGEDDPYHLVLFSDISDYLSFLPQSLDRLSLVQAFLAFSHLPPLCQTRTANQRVWWQDVFLRDELLIARNSEQSDATSGSFLAALQRYMACPMLDMEMSIDLLFDYGFTRPADTFDPIFIRNALRQVATHVADDVLAEYLFVFEFMYFPDEAMKTAKQFLKKRSSSLRLYNTYALMEARRGNTEKSDHVFSTALGMSNSLPESARRDATLLWRTWVWEALTSNDAAKAFQRIASIGGSSITPEVSPAAILKARSFLTEGRDHALSTADYTSATLYTSCLALLAYLSNNHDIATVLPIFHETQTYLSKRNLSTSAPAELAAQSLARLLAHHATHSRIFQPSLIRSALEECIARFPSNSYLLAVYAANESRFRIDDRVRAVVYDEVLSGHRNRNSSIVGWVFSIYSEMLRSSTAGSTVHSIRAAFEKAEEDERGKRSVAVWMSHVLFELRLLGLCSTGSRGTERKAGEREKEARDRVKRVYLRGLTCLPWCKRYMMLALSHLRGCLGWGDLRGVYNILIEKEMRVYVNIEEVLEEAERLAVDVESGED